MVSDGGLAEGHEICLGALVFIADDFAWLHEAPLDVDALPICGATHFRACVRGVLFVAIDPVSVGSDGIFSPCCSPLQAIRSVAASAVGETRGGSTFGHPSSHDN